MFIRLTPLPGSLPIVIRSNRVVAIARTEDGGSRLFLGGALSCEVTEDEETVLSMLQPTTDDDNRP